MFDVFKKLFTRTKGDATAVASSPETQLETAEAPSLDSEEASAPASAPLAALTAPAAPGGTVNLPVKSIIPRLPDQVRMKVNLVGASQATVNIPVEKILERLPYGSVQISIDELKQFSPPRVFAQVDMQEQVMVELPLAEILSHIDPALLKRKPDQRRIEIPKAVTALFSNKGEALPQASPSPEEAARAEALKHGAVAPPATTVAPKPAAPPGPSASPGASISGLRDQALAAMAAATKPPSGVSTAPALEGGAVTVALSTVTAGWPGEVRQEIVKQNLSGATLALPPTKVEEAMRVGHVAFYWKEIRTWLNPAPTAAASPETAEVVLEIPLSVVAPLFLPRLKVTPGKRKAFVEESIPDIFTQSGEPMSMVATPVMEAPRPIAATPADAVAAPVIRPAMTEPAPAKEKHPASLEDLISKPPKKPSNPNEIVQKMIGHPGVVGALITLQEGLLVASHWAPGVKADTLGAFVPQIFSRINQYMREMQLGEIHSATIALDKSTLHIFKRGNLYFAVLGRAGQQLPLPSILAIASELTPQHS